MKKEEVNTKKISKIFQTSSIFDVLPINKWWEKEEDKNLFDDDDDNKSESSNADENSVNSSNDSNSENKKDKMYIGGKNEIKFTNLEHNGVIFPQSYEAHNVAIKYKGEPIQLPPNIEELATFWAQTLDADISKNETARKNFFLEFRYNLKKHSPEFKEKFEKSNFEDFDFTAIYDYFKTKAQKKKERSSDEKKEEKEKKMKLTEFYGVALVDGFPEKVSNFMVEPPGIFRRRGEHPGNGKLKSRILPEDVTINVGPDDPVPACNLTGHNWKAIINNQNSTWLSMYKEDKSTKYVFLAGNSKFKGRNDLKKYEKAKKLKSLIGKIREDYMSKMESSEKENQQLGVATYLIDKLALRVGNEKDDDEADTVGCCSLRVEHIQLNDENDNNKNIVTFDFLGKDSMRYHNSIELVPKVVELLKKFVRGKNKTDDLFDLINVSKLIILRQEN